MKARTCCPQPGENPGDNPSPLVRMETFQMSNCTGPESAWAHAVAMGQSGGSAETAHLFPEGWSTPGDSETRTSTIRQNAEAGLWLPLFIPEGCDGHVGAVDPETGIPLPEVIFYAANHVASMFDQKFGPIDSSRDARYSYAVELANEAAQSTSSPNVRELQ